MFEFVVSGLASESWGSKGLFLDIFIMHYMVTRGSGS